MLTVNPFIVEGLEGVSDFLVIIIFKICSVTS